ncbi:hypothetical protein BH20VER2_BH20VER2_10430 [soil metagenome]|nr:hypothetical protein [Chthoniobacterales bacterium]
MRNVYLELTEQFNAGSFRAIISSGQAVVLHRLAIMSKDGDWILREHTEAIEHVLNVLAEHGARYRFGAPLDARWLAGGWSAHLEFREGELRVRTDFVTRPARIDPARLSRFWEDLSPQQPVVDPVALAEIKKTNREKDYVVIGELARLMRDPAEQFLYSRSARDLLELAAKHGELLRQMIPQRPLLTEIHNSRTALEAALDAERRMLMRVNEVRLASYRQAAERWAAAWPAFEQETRGLPLQQAHRLMVERAVEFLPFAP